MNDYETTVEIVVRSTDMDTDRVVNNAVYFNYFEQARLKHLRRLKVFEHPWQDVTALRPFALAATEARYLVPTMYPETLRVTARTRAVRTRRFVLAYEAVRLSDGQRVAEGSSAQVWLDDAGQAAPIPDHIWQLLLVSSPDADQAPERTG